LIKPGTSGLPYDGVEIAVVDEDWNNPQPQAWPHADHQREKDHIAPLAIAQEDSPDEIGTAVAEFVRTNRAT
jgi:acyl-coenzyme A synthetase/AMP-(fatty) acid ligase